MTIIGAGKIKYFRHAKASKPKGAAEAKADRQTHQAYRSRDADLPSLGYASYAEYLKSDDWKRIRDDKLRKFPACLLCDQPASQVHHLDYRDEVILGLVPQLLVTLCRKCHEDVEFVDGRKVSLAESGKRIRQLAQEKGLQRWLRSVKKAKRLAQGRRHAGADKIRSEKEMAAVAAAYREACIKAALANRPLPPEPKRLVAAKQKFQSATDRLNKPKTKKKQKRFDRDQKRWEARGRVNKPLSKSQRWCPTTPLRVTLDGQRLVAQITPGADETVSGSR